ncbi:hypothetical protein K438DRAFT_1758826 [Mycena galopus ATCC 62051]|nr:hypothetical protein K438DRAFT_1758826 [Mycena galopus ATCC 62051]
MSLLCREKGGAHHRGTGSIWSGLRMSPASAQQQTPAEPGLEGSTRGVVVKPGLATSGQRLGHPTSFNAARGHPKLHAGCEKVSTGWMGHHEVLNRCTWNLDMKGLNGLSQSPPRHLTPWREKSCASRSSRTARYRWGKSAAREREDDGGRNVLGAKWTGRQPQIREAANVSNLKQGTCLRYEQYAPDRK